MHCECVDSRLLVPFATPRAKPDSASAFAKLTSLCAQPPQMALGFEKMEKGSLGAKYTDRTNPMDKHFGLMVELRDFAPAPPAPQMFGACGPALDFARLRAAAAGPLGGGPRLTRGFALRLHFR